MFENQAILNKIESWAERLPYKSIRIEIELQNQSLVLNKEKPKPPIGFAVSQKDGD